MIQMNKDDLLEISMDLNGIMDLLTVMESSEYYTNGDAGICRALRNSIQFTIAKLNHIINEAKEVPFAP